MVAFIAITSVVNIAAGYWLASYLLTGTLFPSFRGRPKRHDAKSNVDSPKGYEPAPIGGDAAAAANVTTQIQPRISSTAPVDGSMAVGMLAPASASPVDAPTSLNVGEVAKPQPASAALQPSSRQAESDAKEGDASSVAVEENVLAGIEAFRSQLAEMKDASSMVSMTKK